MAHPKIVIAGGTGFIGQEMIKYFGRENDLVILTRQLESTHNNRNKYSLLSREDTANTLYMKWDGKTISEWTKELEGAALVINLAGKTVNCRYTEKNKKEILDSRVNATKAIGEAIRQCAIPPALWINASSATIYRDARDKPQDEYSGEFHDNFSVQVCQEWEKSFAEQEAPGTRKVALRMAITLGPGGVLIPYFNLLKFGLGGRQGNGEQMYSWVHIEDTCRMISWIASQQMLEGTYNCCSPNPVTNKEFMRILRKTTGYRSGLPAFEWMLRWGAAMIGTETELVLKSRWVVPAKILASGFHFKFLLLEDALNDIISRVPRKQYHLFR